MEPNQSPYGVYSIPLKCRKLKDGRIPVNPQGECLEIPRTYVLNSGGYDVLEPLSYVFEEDWDGVFRGKGGKVYGVIYGGRRGEWYWCYVERGFVVGLGGYGGGRRVEVESVEEFKGFLRRKGFKVRFRNGRGKGIVKDYVRLSEGIVWEGERKAIEEEGIFLTEEEINRKRCARDRVVSKFNYETAKGKVEYGKGIKEFVEDKFL